ncbi:MAG: lipase maturation factor family protein [Opitutaceae bacterium]
MARNARDFTGMGSGSTFLWPRWLVLRAVGLVFVVIFSGILHEGSALIGPDGLMPVDKLVEQARSDHPGALEAFLRTPTLFWLGEGPALVSVLQWSGLLAATALVFNVWPRLALFICWISLLSFARVWRIFSEPQVDWLMLEVALLSIPFAPAGVRPGLGADRPPSPLTMFMMRWLLIRVMLGPGLAKFLSGDPRWRDFSALGHLYETAPSPTVLAYFDHHLPVAWHVFEWGLTFAAEIGAPLLAIFGGSRCRWVALALWFALQAGIQLTCNFGWLNTASIGLGFLLLDDRMLAAARDRLGWRGTARWFSGPSATSPARPLWRSLTLAAGLGTHFTLTILVYLNPAFVPWVVHAFGSVNSYRLYSRFDTKHLVTEFVGSNDGGRTWRPYEFRFFPQRLDRMSPFVAPHFPRFEASLQILVATREEPSAIYGVVAGHLLRRNAEVMRLFREDPFTDRPPRMIRRAKYEYRFTDPETRRTTGNYWRREYQGEYLPMLYLNESGELAQVGSVLEETQVLSAFGNPEAQSRLGVWHAGGQEGLPRNSAQAALWFQRAAEQGFAEGQFNLAVLLTNGDGVARDLAAAAAWCRRAAEQGHADAQFMLGIKLGRGEGVPRDTVESTAWLQVAAANGHTEAARRLALAREALMPATEAAVQRRAKELTDALSRTRK